ncbi:hypothetical protein H2199_007948 [Coniosporium tulheliwenetii]|uniref:Uncharacterized protein n=1 Tax=Coniosporium tulheliwenetii TaxID=3383036 RepID=A0ACC2YMH0_9PEZI|nr:hypothetical protein H2199_007948 [Cladosporium sp. JES 115]
MATGVTGSDEMISGAKIQPLDSETKANVPLDTSSRGSAGTDRTIDQARIDPLGGAGQYQNPLPHADSQGVVGRDETIQGTKIEPLEGKKDEAQGKGPGLDDENVDASRIDPLGEVRRK